ncbi:MAG: hypothetical protein PHW54_00270 [Candidatus Omnitrophica bacterium]|nr:hypothetical protein [Candidatus Omnitrophota bacterium]
MKKLLGVLVFVLLVSLNIAVAAESATEPAAQPVEFGGVVMGLASGSATVQDIDYTTRIATLKFDNGDIKSITAGPDVRNFNQINKGDKVNINYAATAVLSIGGPAQPLAREDMTEVTRAPLGQKPAGSITESANISAVVKDIDYNNRLVTVEGPQRTVTLKIDPQEKDFDKIKKGDEVALYITESLTINVTAP